MRPLPVPPAPAPPSRVVAAAGALGLAIFGVVLVVVVPKFAEVYRQARLAMPESTVALVDLSEFLVSRWWVAPLLFLAVYDVLGRLSPGQERLARVLVPIVVLVLLGWMLWALFHPLIGVCNGGIGGRR
jgi:hypothetical protein